MQTRQEAQALLASHFSSYTTGAESIDVASCCNRVTAEPVYARFSAPSFHSAAMDGLAVRAEETFSASDQSPLTLSLKNGQAMLINTGHPLPAGKNAVIMIENVLLADDELSVVIRSPVYPWQHVRKVGEDIVATELLFPSGHQLKPSDIAALITGGCRQISVRRRPKVVIIPTGSELISLEETLDGLPPAKTIESNSAALRGLAEQAGAEVEVTPIIKDEYDTIKTTLQEITGGDAELVIINAGSSAGNADYTVDIIRELGEVMTHGVTIMPGKPTILGKIGATPVIGIPGYPVSAIIAMEQFVMPLLAHMQGLPLPVAESVEAVLARDLPSSAGIEEFRRIIVGKLASGYVAVPLKKGAGAITTLTRANGLLKIDASSEGEPAGASRTIELLVAKEQIDRTILCTGSHDLSLDVWGDLLRKGSPSSVLASSHVGSFGGILAIKERMCHVAGCHLLDPEDGSYNISSLREYLPDRALRLITLVHREQGFILPKGNPKEIKDIHDLLRDSITFVNRQAGSGTRVLLDYQLQRNHLDPDQIAGYDQDEYTHMAVAVAVLSGKADVGLGIRSAANALELDFIPLVEERYDLIIPEEVYTSDIMTRALEVIASPGFKKAVEALGGYSTRETGEEVAFT